MEKAPMILCDTNILIEFYKGNPNIIQSLQKIGADHIGISVITQAELLYGARNYQEMQQLREHLLLCRCYPLNDEISSLFVGMMEEYALSHKPSIPDLLIAATAFVNQVELFTLNVKDFRYITGVRLITPL